MDENLNEIWDKVDKDLSAIKIKRLNGVSINKELRDMCLCLKETINSDEFKKGMEALKPIEEESKKKYPEYYLPIVAGDPLSVILERMDCFLKKVSNNELNINEIHVSMVFEYLLNFFNNRYFPSREIMNRLCSEQHYLLTLNEAYPIFKKAFIAYQSNIDKEENLYRIDIALRAYGRYLIRVDD